MTRRRWLLGGSLFLLAGGLLATATAPRSVEDIPAGTGYAAWELCTRTMRSDAPFERVRDRYLAPSVQPLPRIWHIEFAPGLRSEVCSTLPLLAHCRAAVFRAGLGCTLIPPDVEEDEVLRQPFEPLAPSDAVTDRWPWGEGEAQSQRLDAATLARLDTHAQAIFNEPSDDPMRGRNVIALLVAHDEYLVYERHGQGHARMQPQLGWSMTKTLTALIAGLLAQDQRISLDAPVDLPRWRDTPKAIITWRQLLNMAPGLAWDEGYLGHSDATEMLFSQANQGAWAADRPLTSEPGSVFTYSTGFSNIAMLRMRQLVGGSHQAIYDYYQKRLFRPLGIRDGAIEPDASGTPVGGARGVLRPVDWLRLGQLVANGGRWQDAQIVPAAFIDFMRAPSPASPSYGGSIWRVDSDRIGAELRARLPDDVVWFAGYMGQLMVVVPSQRLVVLRMGVSQDENLESSQTRDQVLALVADLVADLSGD